MDRDKENIIKTFQNTVKLYHYTSVDSAIRILTSNSLRFGELKKMNDINESYRTIFYKEGIDFKAVEKELSYNKQISLTQDNLSRQGYDIPSMWGHYAEKGNGVCLVFDRNKLFASMQKGIECHAIEYVADYDGSIIIEDEDIPGFFRKNSEKLFFTKTSDWSYEQELRILIKTDETKPSFLLLKDSLIAVIMNFAPDVDYENTVFDSVNVKVIQKITSEIPILEYGIWDGKPNLRDPSGNDWEKQVKLNIDS